MSVRVCELGLIAVLMSSCRPDAGKYFSSLTDAWAEQTLDVAGPSITAALMIAGLTAELCLGEVQWEEEMVDEQPPLSGALLYAMGFPRIDSISTSGTTEIYLREVRIMDREAATLRIVPVSTTESFSLTAEVLDGRGGQTFGSLTFIINDSCDGSARWVSGSAKWSDLSGVDHTITIPADETDLGLKFECAYIPNDGTLSWSGSIGGQARRFTSADAAEIGWVYKGSSEKKKSDTGSTDTGDTDTGDTDTEIPNCDEVFSASAIEWGGVVVGGADDWSATTVLDILYGWQ